MGINTPLMKLTRQTVRVAAEDPFPWKQGFAYKRLEKDEPDHSFGLATNPRSHHYRKQGPEAREKHKKHGYELVRHYHWRLCQPDLFGTPHLGNSIRLNWSWIVPKSQLIKTPNWKSPLDYIILRGQWFDVNEELSGYPEGDWAGGVGFIFEATEAIRSYGHEAPKPPSVGYWDDQIEIVATVEEAEQAAEKLAKRVKKGLGWQS
jgi:hypothetical protein